jgi:hypothetical protein
MITKKTRTELDKSMRGGKRELEPSQARINKLDDIIQRHSLTGAFLAGYINGAE